MDTIVRIGNLYYITGPSGQHVIPVIAGGVDDLVLNAGAGGSTLATDEVGIRHFQRIKITDGAAEGTAGVPAPVTAPASGDAGLVTRTIERRLGATLSTTALGISGVFTQAGQDGNADGVKYVQAAAQANVASAASGFVIEEYDLADDFVDANFIRTVASASVPAGGAATRINGVVRARKWRVKYTNGGTAQTTFTLAAAADDIPAYLVDSTGALIVGLLDSAGARISPALTGQLPAALVGGRLDITIGASPATVPISAASLPLPAGAATAAAQLAAGHTVDVTDRAARLVGQVEGRAADGIAVAGNPNLIAGRDAGGLAQSVTVDAAGDLQVDVLTLPALVAGSATIGAVTGPTADNAANPTLKLSVLPAVALAATPTRTEGNVNPLRVTLAGDLAVTLDAEAVVLGAGAAIIGSLAANQSVNMAQVAGTAAVTGGVAGLLAVAGNVAHDAVDAGNPVKIGGQANLNERTAVAAGDRVDAWLDLLGRQVVIAGHANPETPITVNITTAAATAIIATPGASLSNHICKGVVSNRAAAKREVSLLDGVTVRWGPHSLAADGGGMRFDFGSRGWKLAANAALNATMDAAGNIQVSVEEWYIAA